MHTFRLVGFVVAAASMALPAAASVITAGNPASECYARLKVGDATTAVSSNTIECTNGDPSCDQGSAADSCLFKVALCLNQTGNGSCSPPGPAQPLTSVKPKGVLKKLRLQPPDLASSTCGATVDVVVRLKKKGRKPGKAKLVVATKSPVAPKKDKDVVKLKCNPSGTTTTTLPGPALCDANPQGGPSELDLIVGDTGTDLDNGWTGVAQNFPVPPRSPLKVCLTGCDASTNPLCDVNGPTGEGSLNGTTFGPPLPLITQNVPVCVINRYQPGPITGKVNVQTGEVTAAQPLQVNLFADVHFTFNDAVCPRCTGPNATDYGGQGTCDGGESQGRSCTVESISDVPLAEGNTTYRLSSACPPARSQAVGTLDIRLPLTTGTSMLAGPKPCRAQPGDPSPGINVQDDACGTAGCGPLGGCAGDACRSRDSQNRCIDAKGGISQRCCNAPRLNVPCFETATGAIERTGSADPPKDANGMAWPNGTYPKTSTGGALVATFCEAATTADQVNQTTGLPGPGALILPGAQTLLMK